MEEPLEITVKFVATRRHMLSRTLSGVILSLAVAFLVLRSETSQGAMGKAAFLASQTVRYDKYLSHPHFGPTIVAGFLMVSILLGAYELLASAIDKLIFRRLDNEKASHVNVKDKQPR
jgi:hypothetical protein